ncbi:MAG: DNA translocase FtsK [Chthoniobacterales bacterium]
MSQARRSKMVDEILGVVIIGIGIILFLALISYSPADLPPWLFFAHSAGTRDLTQNMIGPVGAIIAGFCYFFFGASSYFLAVSLVGVGIAKFFSPSFPVRERIGWLALFVISGACLFELQHVFLQGWKAAFNIPGPGGAIGHWLGGGRNESGKTYGAFASLFNVVGASIFFTIVYLASLILMTGAHPIKFVKQVIAKIREGIEARRQQKLAALTENERAEQERATLEKQAEKLERKLKKKAPSSKIEKGDDETEEEVEALPTQKFPEPKIIDASVPAPAPKPTLAEINAKRAKKAEKTVPTLSEMHLENYTLPSLDLLDPHDMELRTPADPNILKEIQTTIIDTLRQFGIEVSPGDITKGPTITRYEVYPARGVRVDKITSLERDLARATRAERINILAPIPGKDTVGIEIANSTKIKVTLRELLESNDWEQTKGRLPIALGKDVYGKTIIADLAQMPHGLVAGTTGSGKSVCINSIIASLLYKFTPQELRFIMIDPKVVEMQLYNTLPHLVTPVVTDPKKVLLALRWVIDEMELRYRIFAKCGVRNMMGFNDRPKPKSQAELDAEKKAAAEENGEEPEVIEGEEEDEIEEEVVAPKIQVHRDDELVIPEQMPYIVVIIDELADLMQTAPADVESAIARITQMARAAGIHMIVATQTPRADIVTGIIKANIPSRVAFQVASKIDSRVILDENGAERLLGQGDMLYLPPGSSRLIRAQGVFVSEEEIHKIVDFVSKQTTPQFEPSIHEKLTATTRPEEDVTAEDEELVAKCLDIIKQERKASTSMLQRRLRLGYTRAARVVDILELRGVLGPKDGAKDREILVDLDSLP